MVGFYLSVERDSAQAKRAIGKLERSVEKILEETGMSVEELAMLFDLRRALPS